MFALLTLAAEEAEKSKVPYMILASLLIVTALSIATYGIAHHETFPSSKGLARGLSFLMVLLVAGTMAMAVYTA
jgi:hypothetical protein